MGINTESADWDKIADGLGCRQAVLPVDSLDIQSSYALAYHSVSSIRARCQKNVITILVEPRSYSAEAILSTKSPTGHQLAVRLIAAPEKRLEIIVCSDNLEESSNSVTDYEKRYKELLERVGKLDEESRNRIVKTIEVEMKLDAALDKILRNAPVSEVYPPIGIVREALIKTIEGFDPIHIETGAVMENLCGLSQETPLDPQKSRSIGMKILDWKMRLSRKINEEPMPAQEASMQS
jgi:hypothetical protein